MPNTFRIKRRVSGAPGAPSGLKNAELAFNEVDNILYYGKGLGTGDEAAAVVAIGGPGLYVALSGDQVIEGNKTFNGNVLINGTINVPTVAAGDNSTKAASTAWVRGYAQPLNSVLNDVALLTGVGVVVRTSSGFTVRTLAGTSGRVAVTNGDGQGAAPTIDLVASGVGAGTYTKVGVDIYGRVISAGSLASGDVTSALGYTPENPANKGAPNGYAPLGSDGLVPAIYLPAGGGGGGGTGLNYKGAWNAATNSPALASGVGTKGDYYKVSVAGATTIDGQTGWTVGDLIVYNGTTWDQFQGGAADVISVAGRTGVVTLSTTDISGLGTMALQNANNVAITGGTIDNVVLDGGTF